MKKKIVPEELKKILREPVGMLLTERAALARLKQFKPRLLIAVGDTSGFMLLKNRVKPHIFVFDFKNLRVPVSAEVREEIERHAKKVKKVRNEAGTISEEMEKAVKKAVEAGKGNIFVEGEEDLAALVAFAHAPDGAVVIYGQPHEGVVLVEVSEEMRKKAQEWLAQCKSA